MQILDFNEMRDALKEMREAKNSQKRSHTPSQATGNLDSSDDYEQFHVYKTLNSTTWEVWTPFANAVVLTFEQEENARHLARYLNRVVGSGEAVYTGRGNPGPSYA